MISLANGALITRPFVACEYLGINAINSQVVRWRKPMWLGTAKSKIFRIPVKPTIPREEMAEIMRLSNNYRTYRESLRRYFMDVAVQNLVQFDEESLKKEQDEDYARCLELNNQWNAEVGKSREMRELEALEERKKKVLSGKAINERREEVKLARAEKRIEKVKRIAETFITEQTIDQAIEEALGNVVDYNAAIDSDGNKYDGTNTIMGNETAQLRADQ